MRRVRLEPRPWRLGIILLILAFLHVPMPLPDFHSLSHHDHHAGEVCARHQHLLRWHSDGMFAADDAEDEAATLHWHWVWPRRQPNRADSESPDTPLIQPDGDPWLEPTWELASSCLAPGRDRSALDFNPGLALSPLEPRPLVHSTDGRAGPRPPGGAPARRSLPTSVLQRWNC